MKRLGFLLALVTLLAGPLPGLAQMVQWTDDRGQVHYSQGLDSVPERFRAAARPLPYQPGPASPETREAAAGPAGGAKIPFKPGSPIIVSAKINGGGPVTLMLDTGADTTVVNPLALWRLGISTWFAPRAEIRGATGTSRVDVVRVDSIEVGGAKAGPLTIIAHDVEMKEMDGLLGRDFLNHFSVNIDAAAGVVTLTPR